MINSLISSDISLRRFDWLYKQKAMYVERTAKLATTNNETSDIVHTETPVSLERVADRSFYRGCEK